MKAIAIIQDEHRAITSVIEGLRHMLVEVAAGRIPVDHALIGAMFHYIEAFPEKLHHPKEDDFLFARLRARRPEAAPLLDALEAEHAVGRERFAELKATWERFRDDASTLAALKRLASSAPRPRPRADSATPMYVSSISEAWMIFSSEGERIVRAS